MAHTKFQGHVYAAEIGVLCSLLLMLPKIGFNEAYADCSPGNSLIEAVVKDAFSRRRLREMNHLDDQASHRLWRKRCFVTFRLSA